MLHHRSLFHPFHQLLLEVLYSYYWPGNVRELENTIERACVLGVPPTITDTDLRLNAKKPIEETCVSFLDNEDDKTLKTFEETIEENGIKLAMETLFEWVILEAIPKVNNERIFPKAIKEDENHWFLNTELAEEYKEECE